MEQREAEVVKQQANSVLMIVAEVVKQQANSVLMIVEMVLFKLAEHIYKRISDIFSHSGVLIRRQHIPDIEILYRSANFLVVDKPYDVRINSNNPEAVTVETQLQHKCPHLADPKLMHSFRFIHRLDSATSGLLCLALNKTAASEAARAFQKRKTRKHYIALVRGHVKPAVLTEADRELTDGTKQFVKWSQSTAGLTKCKIKIGLGADSSTYGDYVNKQCVETCVTCVAARKAATTLLLLEHGVYDGRPVSKVLLVPKTGRTHQLRAHCKYLGHPIVGDYMYSERTDTEPYRMMLHAIRLLIPTKLEALHVISPDPFTPQTDKLWTVTETFNDYQTLCSSWNLQTDAGGGGGGVHRGREQTRPRKRRDGDEVSVSSTP